MEMYAIENSKVVLEAGYDPTTRILRLELRTQPDYYYDYSDVYPHTYADLLESGSVGRFYGRYIKNHFSSKKVLISEAIQSESNSDDSCVDITTDELAKKVAVEVLSLLAKKLG